MSTDRDKIETTDGSSSNGDADTSSSPSLPHQRLVQVGEDEDIAADREPPDSKAVEGGSGSWQGVLAEAEAEEEVETTRRRLSNYMRDTESLTEEMKMEVIELLKEFSLPYLIAPFEAEAQCAVLEQLGLVNGVVTEDSDTFLFGAKTVYKNIFTDKKFVEVLCGTTSSLLKQP
jgi:5'-3' exonuclease